MKKVIEAENTHFPEYDLFENTDYRSLELTELSSAALTGSNPQAAMLDKFLAIIKFVFLFLPGAAALHFLLVGVALLTFYEDHTVERFTVIGGVVLVSTFMIMLGIGKLNNLKYLRVVGAVAAASAVCSLLYSILITLVPGDYFGLFIRYSFLIPILVGYAVKLDTDRRGTE